MTCLPLTAEVGLWPVIGLTVIGTVSLPLLALEMHHNAAVDLAAAVRRKPCNYNFHRIFSFFSFFLLNTNRIIYELSAFQNPWATENWSAASMQFQKHPVVNEKIRPQFIIAEELVCRYTYLPDSNVLLLPAVRLEGKFSLKSAAISAKTTQTQR